MVIFRWFLSVFQFFIINSIIKIIFYTYIKLVALRNCGFYYLKEEYWNILLIKKETSLSSNIL